MTACTKSFFDYASYLLENVPLILNGFMVLMQILLSFLPHNNKKPIILSH